MKKLLLCASAFALMLGSCSKDDTEVAPVEGTKDVAFNPNRSLEFLCVVRQREILYSIPNREERLPCF